ncbi:MAG: hypothetical protein AAAC49_14975, partial [Rhizobium leguminosarum]
MSISVARKKRVTGLASAARGPLDVVDFTISAMGLPFPHYLDVPASRRCLRLRPVLVLTIAVLPNFGRSVLRHETGRESKPRWLGEAESSVERRFKSASGAATVFSRCGAGNPMPCG